MTVDQNEGLLAAFSNAQNALMSCVDMLCDGSYLDHDPNPKYSNQNEFIEGEIIAPLDNALTLLYCHLNLDESLCRAVVHERIQNHLTECGEKYLKLPI